jgi:hypothetical protein
MQLSTKDARRVMEKLMIQEIPCKHHSAGFLVVDGVRILKLHCSFGSKDMPPTVVHLFRKSLKLSVDEFQQLTGCKTSRAAYIQILRDKGYLRGPVDH